MYMVIVESQICLQVPKLHPRKSLEKLIDFKKEKEIYYSRSTHIEIQKEKTNPQKDYKDAF